MSKALLGYITLGLVMGFFGYFLWINQTPSSLVSPISIGKISNNQWFPEEGRVLGQSSDQPVITAKAAYFFDADSGDVLYQKNEHIALPIASLSKIMTALVALENHKLSDILLVSKRAADTEPDKMLLREGETMSVEDLLKGIFLVSANDAAEVIAEETFYSRDKFITQMNSKAKSLGLNQTSFINPTGLDEDSAVNLSSAYDLALLSRYLIRNFPQVLSISSLYHVIIPKTESHQDYEMYSGINLLTSYPGVIGLKTGFTPKAGYTLVTLARNNNHTVIGVLLDSGYRREEAKKLLDYSFERLSK